MATFRTLHVLSVSDTHGWLYGHRHQPDLGNYGLLFSYIEHMQAKVASDTSADVLAFDGGDIIEGTGLSDTTQVRGQLIYEIAATFPFDILTLGNHDMDNADSSQYLSENAERLFGDKLISANTFKNSDNEPLIKNTHKYLTLKNGIRVLVFSFLFHAPAYEFGYTKPAARVIKSAVVQDVLDKYKYMVDVLIIDNHMGSDDAEWEDIYMGFRNYYDRQNYTIPMVFLASHSHILAYKDCPFDGAQQCYIVEAECYLRHLHHVTYTLMDINYTHEHISYTGVQMVNIDANLPTDFTYKNCARRLDMDQGELITENGARLQRRIDDLVEHMKLGTVVGYSPIDYLLTPPYDAANSIYYLWAKRIIPTKLYGLSAFNGPCIPIAISIRPFFREPVYAGDITLDDTYSILPVRYTVNHLDNVTYNELFCVTNYMNNLIHSSNDVPEVIIEEDPGAMDRDACYNVIISSYEAKYIPLTMSKLGPCYSVSTASKSYESSVLYAETDMSDEIKAGENFTMGELLRAYIGTNMPVTPKASPGNLFLPLIIIASLFGCGIVLSIILLIFFSVKRKRCSATHLSSGYKGKPEEEHVLVYDSDTITTESVTDESNN